jgi:transcriptional regulator with XRE-family HTH domain
MIRNSHDLALEIRRARARRGLSQRDLASRVGKAQSRVAEAEDPEGNPTLATLVALAAALDMGLFLVPRERVQAVERLLADANPAPAAVPTVFEELFVPDPPSDEEDEGPGPGGPGGP